MNKRQKRMAYRNSRVPELINLWFQIAMVMAFVAGFWLVVVMLLV